MEDRVVPTFLGGVRVAGGDLNGDGFADIITGAGPGGAPHVRALSGQNGSDLHSFYAGDATATGGVSVAAGHLTDGKADSLITAGTDGQVRVYDGPTGSENRTITAFAATFGTAASVATGDISGDGYEDIVVGAGAGGDAHVKVFDGRSGELLRSFYAYAPGFTGGVNVAAGDVTGDGLADIVTGAGAGGTPHVKVFDGATGAVVQSFYAYALDFRGGVYVAAGDMTGDGIADIITGAGAGGTAHVKVFDGARGEVRHSELAYADSFTGGAFVGAADLNGDGLADLLTGAGPGGGSHVRGIDVANGTLLASFYAYGAEAGGALPNGNFPLNPPGVPPTPPGVPPTPPGVPPTTSNPVPPALIVNAVPSLTNTNPTVTGAAGDFNGDLDRVEVSVDGGPFAPVALAANGTFAFTPTFPLNGTSDGLRRLSFRATDRNNNQSLVREVTFTLDSVGPTVTGVPSGTLTTTPTELTATFSEPITGLSASQLTLTAGGVAVPVAGVDAQSATVYRVRFGQSLANGSYTLALAGVTDLAGNSLAGPTTFAFNVAVGPGPVTLPTVTLQLDPASDSGVLGDSSTILTAVTLVGTADPGAAVTLAGRTVTVGADGRFQFATVPLTLGTNSFTVTATRGGETVSATVTIVRENLPAGTIRVAEEDRFLSTQTIPVDTAAVIGSRSIRFDLTVGFDTSDTAPAVEDVILLTLVDAANPEVVLLSERALLSLSGADTESTPGLVRYDGRTVEIDTSTLANAGGGLLRVQVLNSDADTGTEAFIGPVETLLDVDGTAAPVFAARVASAAVGSALDLATLSAATDLKLEVDDVRFDEAAKVYTASLRVVNVGLGQSGRNVAVVFPGLPAGVTVVGPSGTDVGGNPYLSFTAAIPPGGLAPGESSAAIRVTVENATLARFSFTPTLLAGATNRAPVVPVIAPVTVMPGGCVDIDLGATDADGDTLTYRLRSTGAVLPTGVLQADGTLVVSPAPGEIGNYQFEVVVGDGATEVTRVVAVSVVADPVTTTRVSGVIQNTDQQPLANVPVEIGTVSGVTDAQGRFTLDLGTGPLPGDTLRVLGRAIPGNYPFIAEKLPLVLGHAVYYGVENVICRPIYLPPLNDGTPVNPNANTTVTRVLQAGEAAAAVQVAAGTLKDEQNNPFAGDLSITEVPAAFTPAALPTDRLPDLVVTIQPGDMVFTQPAPLSLPNRAGFAPGTVMDLWSINPVTGDFDDVGDGVVSADGKTVTTTSGGIRNSSWHFFTPPPPPPTPDDKDDKNKDKNCEGGEATAPGGSEVELHSGALLETHDLVPYTSLGQSRGWTLSYDSERADARPIVHFGYQNVVANSDSRLVARLTVMQGDFQLQVPGFAGGMGLPGGEHFWKLDQAGSVGASLQADLRDLPTGVYDYNLVTGILRLNNGSFAGSTSAQTGQFVVVNSRASEFGAGWGLAGLLRIVENADGSLLLVNGSGGELRYGAPAAAGQPYDAPPGHFDALVKLADGTFRRTFTDQSVERFDNLGRLVSQADRLGNATAFAYNPSGIDRITDPVGLVTVFGYAGGRVTSITDPSGKVTRLKYDAAGNLTQVIDPDAATRTWEYDADHHMTGETDARGMHEEEQYDFAGRMIGAVLKDGTVMKYDPVQTRTLSRPEATTDPMAAPAAFVTAQARASFADGNGNVTEVTLDKAGQTISQRDTAGALPSVGRDSENLIRRSSDGRGFLTSYDYDAKGNVVAVRDSVGGTGTGRQSNEGREFWLGFQPNLGTPTLSLFLTGQVATTGTVEIPGLNFSQTFTITPDEITTITVPAATATLVNNAVSNRGIHVVADAPITAYGLNRVPFTTDGYLGLPVEALGTEYLLMSNSDAFGRTGHFSVVGTLDDTDVTITLPRAMGGRPANVPFTIRLNTGEEYYLVGADATGVSVSSTKPVAVFSGHPCGNVPTNATACDHLVEQMPPLDTWGQDFVTAPLATRRNGDTFRFLASTDDTEVRVNSVLVATLNRGEFFETILTVASVVSSTKPILVAQFSNGSSFDGVTSDPFMLLVPPFEQFNRRYTVTTPATGFATNFVNVVIPTNAAESLRLDGQPVAATLFAPIGDSAFSAAQLPVALGSHRLTADVGFGLFVYGFDSFDSYGYLGGQAFVPGAARFYEYDPIYNRVTKAVDELGQITLSAIDPNTGNVTRSTRVFGQVDDALNGETDDLTTGYTYTARGLVDTMTDPRGFVTDYDYDAFERLTKVTYAKGTANQATRTYEYDAAGNQTAMTDENGNRTTFQYDLRNRLVRTTEADPDGAGPLASPVTNYAYDTNGNVTTTTDARGNRTVNKYDEKNRLVSVTAPDPDGTGPQVAPVTRYAYDKNGNLISVADPLGQVTSHTYDGRDRRVSTTDPDGGVTRFAYDSDGNLTKVTDPTGNVTRFGYDARERLIRETDPLGKNTIYAYDTADNLVSKLDRNGRETKYEYDNLNRLTKETWLEGGANVNTVRYSYDPASNLLSVSDAFSALTMTYDARNRLSTVSTAGSPGQPAVILQYSYDGVGNVTRVSDSLGTLTAYAYDALNRPTTVSQANGTAAAKRVDFAYNPLGQYTSLTRYSDTLGAARVAETVYSYDAMNRLTTLTHQGGNGTTVAGYTYAYDRDSRLTSINSRTDGVVNYGYDDRDQLTGADYANTAITDESYTYDANGNRVSSHRHGTDYVTDPNTANRLKSDGVYTYEYDGEGNQTKRTTIADGSVREFGWDHRNRLVRVTDTPNGGVPTEVTFTYDALNRRITKTAAGATTIFIYDREDVLLDYVDPDASGAQPAVLAVRYLHGPGIDQVLAEDRGGGNVRWLLTDHLGTSRDIINNAGAVVNHVLVDAYGNVLSQTNATAGTRYIFTGREFDSATGLYYYRTRYYDAATGRFLSQDRVKFEAGDANLYRYSLNDPSGRFDPHGEESTTVTRIEVDLSRQKATAYSGDQVVGTYDVVTGANDGHATPPGKYKIWEKDADYVSKKYKSPMPYSMFFDKDRKAIHGTKFPITRSYLKAWGAYDWGSKGCVGMRNGSAKELFDMTPVGTPVIVK